jgi:predicted RNA methylase
MFDEHRRPLGRPFYLLALFLLWLGAGWAQTPTTTTISEGLFGSRSGVEKKDAAMSFVTAALQLSDAVTSRHIVDPDKFKQGLSAVIDGTVLCLNASTWSKPSQP